MDRSVHLPAEQPFIGSFYSLLNCQEALVLYILRLSSLRHAPISQYRSSGPSPSGPASRVPPIHPSPPATFQFYVCPPRSHAAIFVRNPRKDSGERGALARVFGAFLCSRSQAEALRSQIPKKMGSVRSKTSRACKTVIDSGSCRIRHLIFPVSRFPVGEKWPAPTCAELVEVGAS